MADRANGDPIQDILDELDQVRTRETELLVQLSAILRTAQGPPAPARAPPRIRLRRREGYPDSQGNLVVIGARVRFSATARTRAGTGRVTSWTNRANQLRVPDPYCHIERDIPPGTRCIGSRNVYRKCSSITLLPR